MPVTTATRMLGIEAKHEVRDLAGTLLVTLNDPDALPLYRLQKIGNLGALPDLTDNREQETGQSGEVEYPSYYGGKTLTYEGLIAGSSAEQMRQGEKTLALAFGPDPSALTNSQPTRRIVAVPNASYGTQQFTFTARCVTLTCDDSQDATPWAQPYPFQRSFVIALRMADPRFFLWDGTTATSPRW